MHTCLETKLSASILILTASLASNDPMNIGCLESKSDIKSFSTSLLAGYWTHEAGLTG